jgi:hypothetical protein
LYYVVIKMLNPLSIAAVYIKERGICSGNIKWSIQKLNPKGL